MRGRCRVRRQRFGVADIDQPREQLQGVQEACAGSALIRIAALEAERKNPGGAPAHQALHDRMVGVVGQTGVAYKIDLRVLLQELGQRQRVIADAIHAQRQGLDPLQDQERIHRRKRRALVAQRHHTRTANVGRRAERLGVDDAMVADIRFVQAWEALAVLRPREFATIDNGATDAVAVATQILGERMHDDIGAVLDRAQQV